MADDLKPYDGPIVPLASHENLTPYSGEILPHEDVPVKPGATQSNAIDDTAHAAGPGTIARASLAPDPQVQIKRYAESFNQPESDFGIIGDHIVRKVPETGEYARVEPSVRGATGPIDAAKRAFDWVAGGAGPAIPAITSGLGMAAAGLIGAPSGPGALATAMAGGSAGASAGEIARQKLDAALAPKGQEADMDWGNVGWQGAAGAAGPIVGKAVSALGGRVAPVLADAAAEELPPAETAIKEALRDGTIPIAPKGAAADALAQRIKGVAQDYYKKAEDAGVVISQDSFTKFATDLPDQLIGYHPAVNDQAAKIIKMLQGEAAEGPMTLQKLDSLRSVASGISAGQDLNEARIAGNIVGKIDKYIDDLKPDDLAKLEKPPDMDWYQWRNTENARVDTAADALKSARGMWQTYSKLKTINDIVDTGEMLNDQNWVKGRFRALVKSSQFDRFSPDEQDAIASVARTGNLEKAIKLLPWRGLQMASTYAEPLMQDAKIGSVQNLIAKSAPDVPEKAAAIGQAIQPPDDGALIGKLLPQAAAAGAADQVHPEQRRRVEVVDVPGLRK